jgi:hypothetical protein
MHNTTIFKMEKKIVEINLFSLSLHFLCVTPIAKGIKGTNKEYLIAKAL